MLALPGAFARADARGQGATPAQTCASARKFLNRKSRRADAGSVAEGGRRNRSGAGADPASRLERVFAAVLEQIRQDPAFAQRILGALGEAAAASAPAPSVVHEPAPRPQVEPPASTRPPPPPPPPPPPKRQKALLDPYALYETGWEAMLRSHLERLDVEQLRDVIHQYRMDSAGFTATLTSVEELRSFIIQAVEDFGMS